MSLPSVHEQSQTAFQNRAGGHDLGIAADARTRWSMDRRTDIASGGHKIRVHNYTLCLDVKMHIDGTGDTDSATIDRIRVAEIFDRAARRD